MAIVLTRQETFIGKNAEAIEAVHHQSADTFITVVVPVDYKDQHTTPADVLAILEKLPSPPLISRIILLDDNNVSRYCQEPLEHGESAGYTGKDLYLLRHEAGTALEKAIFTAWCHFAFEYFEIEARAYCNALLLEGDSDWPGPDWIHHLTDLFLTGQTQATPLRRAVLFRFMQLLASRNHGKAWGQSATPDNTDTAIAAELRRHAGSDKVLGSLALFLLADPALALSSPELDLSGEFLVDTDAVKLSQLKNLQLLDLSFTLISGQTLAAITGMTSLRQLNLEGTAVTNSSLRQLEALPLETLNLAGTKVSDGGLVTLSKIKTLKHLNLRAPGISKNLVATLQKELPHCEILA